MDGPEPPEAGPSKPLTDPALSQGDSPPDLAKPEPIPSALPSVGARVAAFAAIVASGACGGLIGFALVDLQCEGSCTNAKGFGALVGAAMGALGVAVVAVLALRAMGEWKTIQARVPAPRAGKRHQPAPKRTRRKPSA